MVTTAIESADATFCEFFALANDGHRPFGWQRRLLRTVVTTGRWPSRIAAPTGAGKSSVVDVHLFANAATVSGSKVLSTPLTTRVPRRLATVVNRRGLVDSQHERALKIQDLLVRSAPTHPLLNRIANGLSSLRTEQPPDDVVLPPFDVALLRGGVPADLQWRDDPSACLVMCATPDMWGSRLLFRGYGSSRLARPREAGLLAHDTVAVVDEAHLSQQLVVTARQIPVLERSATADVGVPRLQVVETTATPATAAMAPSSAQQVRIEPGDLDDGGDGPLRERLRTPKPLRLAAAPGWPGRGRSQQEYARRIAAQCDELHKRSAEFTDADGRTTGTIGCIVNTVSLAANVVEELEKHALTVVTLVGRMRPHDVQQVGRIYPGLLTVSGNPNVDIIVATQTLEVGIDLDLAGLVTELASASALAQRFGRVNRLGLRPSTEIVVVGPDDEPEARPEQVRPYVLDDLSAAWAWLRRRADDSSGVSPWRLTDDPPPGETPHRVLWQRPELYDAWLWAKTTEDLCDEPELDLWLRDDLSDDDRTAALVVRRHLPSDDAQALALIRETPPLADEAFPADLATLAALVSQILGQGASDSASQSRGSGLVDLQRAFVVRAGYVLPLRDGGNLRPGDVVIVDDSHAVHSHDVVVRDPVKTANDVYDEVQSAGDGPTVVRLVAHDEDSQPWRDVFAAAWASARHKAGLTLEDRHQLATLLGALPQTGTRVTDQSLVAVVAMLRRKVHETDVTVSSVPLREEVAPAKEVAAWLVIRDARKAEHDEDVRQAWIHGGAELTLDDHAGDVGRRAVEIADTLGIDPPLLEVLRQAGLRHDDGKADPRFQRRLRYPDSSDNYSAVLLAKSGSRSRQESRKAFETSELPAHWRHEQQSVLRAAPDLRSEADGDLVLRLVGTSHGYGRPLFPHGSTAVVPDGWPTDLADNAGRLFDQGEWDSLVDRTHAARGVWGCAYLEALLRAADSQVSKWPPRLRQGGGEA